MSGAPDNLPHNPTTDTAAEPGVTPSEKAENPVAAEPLRCSLTGEVIPDGQVYWAPPLVTFQELMQTVGATLKGNPAALTAVLFSEQPDVPYAESSREELGARRSAEQLKFLVLLLVVLALLAALGWLIFGVLL